jgi:hypothetical protein
LNPNSAVFFANLSAAVEGYPTSGQVTKFSGQSMMVSGSFSTSPMSTEMLVYTASWTKVGVTHH